MPTVASVLRSGTSLERSRRSTTGPALAAAERDQPVPHRIVDRQEKSGRSPSEPRVATPCCRHAGGERSAGRGPRRPRSGRRGLWDITRESPLKPRPYGGLASAGSRAGLLPEQGPDGAAAMKTHGVLDGGLEDPDRETSVQSGELRSASRTLAMRMPEPGRRPRIDTEARRRVSCPPSCSGRPGSGTPGPDRDDGHWFHRGLGGSGAGRSPRGSSGLPPVPDRGRPLARPRRAPPAVSQLDHAGEGSEVEATRNHRTSAPVPAAEH